MNARTTATARHRKATRPLTPLASVAPATRRGLAVAASSGLALTMIASGATAAGTTEVGASAGTLENAGVGAIAADARAEVQTNQAVSVAQDASAPADLTAVATVTAQAPVVEVVEEPATTADRTTAADETAPVAQTDTTADTTGTATTGTTDTAAATAATTAAADTPSISASGSAIVSVAMQYVGVPYVPGGSTPAGWDCSGFVQWVYAQVGISLPRTSEAQGAAGTTVSAAQAQPGDIVYYGGHVGIYAGNGMMVDAGNTRVNTSYRAVYGSPTYVHIG